MFINFFYQLKDAGIPVSPTAFLTLHRALKGGLINSLDDFYTTTRAVLVKSERYFDLFDQVFAHAFKGAEMPDTEGFEMDEIARALLDEWGVTPMRSPPVTPQYNGSCEAGNGSMKLRSHYRAASAGRSGRWTSKDVEGARRHANECHYPNGHAQPTPLEVWQSRSPIDHNERRRFQTTVERIRTRCQHAQAMNQQETPTDAERATENRRVVRQALVELGLLSITWRFITLPIKPKKLAKIS